MRKKWLVLSSLGLVVAACSDNSTAPTPPAEIRAPARIVGNVPGRIKIMPLRGTKAAFSGVTGQATGINYHGGPIITTMKVQALYWGTTAVYAGGPTPGTTGTGAQDGSLIGHFLRNLGGSPYYNINSTYTDQVGGGHTVANSITYTGFWADNQNVPPANGTTVTDATMQAELVRGFNTGALTYDPQTIYTIFSKGNTNLGGGFGSQYCAYHSFFTWNGKVVIYSAQPYVGQYLNGCSNQTAAPNGDAAADAEVSVLAHEIEEAHTDPQLNAWWDTFTGEENADKCSWTWGTTYNNGTGVANMNLGGKDFLVQQNWINAGTGGCLKAYTTGPNQPPVAAFTSSCNNTTRACTFNGNGSTDDVGVVSYAWTFGDGATGTGAAPSHTYAAAGTFTVTLTVTDGGGLTNAVSHSVTVTGSTNQPPVANFTFTCNNTTRLCNFNGTSSSDDVGIAASNWTFGDGGTGKGEFPKHTYALAGTYQVTLTVKDAGGLTNSITKAVTVGSVTNQPPVAAFTFSCSNTTRLCSFNGTGSTDDVGIVSYAWTFGDGGTASTSTTSHTYAAPGTFQVTLTVTDGGGLSNAITKAVTLTNQPPVAAFTSSCNNTTRACTFNGSGSTDDVGIVSYAWNFGDAATGTGATPAHTYASAGTYTVTLTVTDGGGLTNAVSHTVTLTSGTNQPPVAAYTVTCQPAPAHTCSLDGTGSVDPDGSIVAYKWTNAEGQVLSTAATFTKSWGASYSPTFTLTVTDNGGLTGKLTKTFTVP